MQQILHDFEPRENRVGFEELLPFDWIEADGSRERVDQARSLERRKLGELSLARRVFSSR